MDRQWNDKIFTADSSRFEQLALEIFRFQYDANPLYQLYCDTLGRTPANTPNISEIPFLPIRFFKTHIVKTTAFEPQAIFESSGTTGSVNSRHHVRDLGIYEESFTRGFEMFYGPLKELVILGLLPSYLERTNSSLVYMVDQLIRLTPNPRSGFYLHNTDELFQTLQELEEKEQKTLLIGVTFALLDFAASHPLALRNTMLMETGGMKGRRKEMVRQEVHDIMRDAFHIPAVHSEYGMTELLSQAYSKADGIFYCPPWMKVLIRDEEDPRALLFADDLNAPRSGAVNVIDLANVYSCSFIATDDAGKLYPDGGFEILGRLDNSDLRGCSLLTI